jgi:carbon monoxide dehydrogenase subunit G
MNFEQTCTIPVPVERLWDFMIDAPAVGACMPGIESFTEVGPDQYAGKVKIKVGPIALRMEGSVAVTERNRDTWTARMRAEGQDKRVFGGVKADLTMTLVPAGAASTGLVVRTDATVLGKLGEFGQPMMKKTADRILAQFVDNIVAKLAAGATPDATAATHAG